MKKLDRQEVIEKIKKVEGVYSSYQQIAPIIGIKVQTLSNLAHESQDIYDLLNARIKRSARYKRYNAKSFIKKLENEDPQTDRFIDCKNYLICLSFSSEYKTNFKFHCNKCKDKETGDYREQFDTYHNY